MMGMVGILASGFAGYRIDLDDRQAYHPYHELVIGRVPMAITPAIGTLIAGHRR